MPLQDLRQALDMSQKHMSELLGRDQSAISKIENETDMYVSTLRSYVEALGGELQIVANLPSGRVTIERFDKLRTVVAGPAGHTEGSRAQSA